MIHTNHCTMYYSANVLMAAYAYPDIHDMVLQSLCNVDCTFGFKI